MRRFLGMFVLAQQPEEIFIAAALPAAIRIGSVDLNAQSPIDGLVIRILCRCPQTKFSPVSSSS
jgi:hypothetical protein